MILTNKNLLNVSQRRKDSFTWVLGLVTVFLLSVQVKTAVTLNSEIQVELFNGFMKSSDPQVFLDLNDGVWYEMLQPAAVNQMVFEFHSNKSGYIMMNNDQTSMLNRISKKHVLGFYDKVMKTTSIDLPVASEINAKVVDLSRVLEYYTQALASDEHAVAKLNYLNVMRLGDTFANQANLFKNLMLRVERELYPSRKGPELSKMFSSLEPEDDHYEKFCKELIQIFLFAVQLNMNEVFINKNVVLDNSKKVGISHKDEVMKPVYEAIQAQPELKALLDKMAQLVTYFHIKLVRNFFFYNPNFLPRLMRARGKTLQDKFEAAFEVTVQFLRSIFSVKSFAEISEKKAWDNIEVDESVDNANYISYLKGQLLETMKQFLAGSAEIMITHLKISTNVEQLTLLNVDGSDYFVERFLTQMMPDYKQITLESLLVDVHEMLGQKLSILPKEKIPDLENEESLNHFRLLLYINEEIEMNNTVYKSVYKWNVPLFAQDNRLLLI